MIPNPSLILQAFDKGTAESWLEAGFRELNAEDLRAGIASGLSLRDLFFKLYCLDNPLVKAAAQTVLRYHFKELEKYLTNVDRVFYLLCRRPDVSAVISTPEGVRWLNGQCRELYTALYAYCYG